MVEAQIVNAQIIKALCNGMIHVFCHSRCVGALYLPITALSDIVLERLAREILEIVERVVVRKM